MAHQAWKANKDFRDEMENEETLDPQDQKVNPAYQVCLVSRETKEKEGTRVPWVIRVTEGLME